MQAPLHVRFRHKITVLVNDVELECIGRLLETGLYGLTRSDLLRRVLDRALQRAVEMPPLKLRRRRRSQ